MSDFDNRKITIVTFALLKIVEKALIIRQRELSRRQKKMNEKTEKIEIKRLEEKKGRIQQAADFVGLVILVGLAALIVSELIGCSDEQELYCEKNKSKMCLEMDIFECKNNEWKLFESCDPFKEICIDSKLLGVQCMNVEDSDD